MAQLLRSRSNNPFERREKGNPNRSFHDLSHMRRTSFPIGRLCPVLLQELLPGDSMKVKGDFMFRFPALYLPIYQTFKCRLDYFMVTNRSLYQIKEFWENFISPQQPTLGDAVWAYFTLDPHPTTGDPVDRQDTDLRAQLGLPLHDYGATPSQTVNISCLPIYAYWRIWEEFYRRPQVEQKIYRAATVDDLLCIPGDNTSRLESFNFPTSQTDALGVGNDDYVLGAYYKLANINYDLDYFTACLPEPQLGSDVLIPIVDIDKITDGSDMGTAWVRKTSDGSKWTATSFKTDTGGEFENQAGIDVFIDQSEQAGTMRQFRLAAMTQQWLEMANRAGSNHRDWIYATFGIDPGGALDDPIFLGRTQTDINVADVVSSADSDAGGSAQFLGDYAGHAITVGNGKTISLKAPDHGWLMAICSIVPRASYGNGIAKMWTRSDRLDYFWSEFNNIGDQAVLKSEIAFDWGEATNDDVFGYIPRFSEYRYQYDINCGSLNTAGLSAFHLGRLIDYRSNSFSIGHGFLKYVNNTSRIFANPNYEEDTFAWFNFQIKAVRPVPKSAIPGIRTV